MTESNEHKMGAVLARVTILENERTRLLDTLDEMSARLGSIERTLATASGSWRTLLAIGTLISVISGAIGALFSHR